MKITNNDIALMGAYVTVAMAVYLAFLSGLGRPFSSLEVATDSNQDTYIYSCSLEVPEIHLALFIVEIFFIVWGVRLCNSTKDAPSAVNESKFIAMATSVIIAICTLVLPVVYFLPITPVAVEIISGFAFSACQFATLAILFIPKVLSLYRGEDVDAKLKVTAPAKIYGENSKEHNSLLDASVLALKGKILDEKYIICQKQIEYWRTMLVVIEERRSSATGSASGMVSEYTRADGDKYISSSVIESEAGVGAAVMETAALGDV